MSSTVTVSEARASLPAIIERVDAGEEVTLTRHGVAVAVVVRPDALRVRRAGAALAAAEQLHELVRQGRRSPLPEHPGLSADRARALLEDVAAARARR